MAKRKKLKCNLSLYDQLKNAPTQNYTGEPLTLKLLEETIIELFKQDEELREWRHKTNWKPQFFITKGFIESLTYEELESLSKHYRFIGGSKAVEALQQKNKRT